MIVKPGFGNISSMGRSVVLLEPPLLAGGFGEKKISCNGATVSNKDQSRIDCLSRVGLL
jgi:hypothetical protein